MLIFLYLLPYFLLLQGNRKICICPIHGQRVVEYTLTKYVNRDENCTVDVVRRRF